MHAIRTGRRLVRGRTGRLLAILLVLMAGSINAQSTVRPDCGHSTVEDAWGPEFAGRAKRFLAELQAAVRSGDKKALSSLVGYPVHVFQQGHNSELTTPKGLIRRLPSIVTPNLKKAVLAQSPDCLFANGQGVMIGRGEIWFEEQSGGQMKIVSFNLRSQAGSK